MSQKTPSTRGGLSADRRTVLTAGLIGAASAAGPAGVQRALAQSRGGGLALYKAVVDSGYADSVAFGGAMADRGVAGASITGDVTALWYDDLYHRWKQGPAAIAGLTDAAALFCLETLANDAGMRVVFRSAYRRTPAGVMEHRAKGLPDLVETAASLPTDHAWGLNMARVVVVHPALCVPSDLVAMARACTAPTEAAQTLTAWIIAPVSRA